MVEIRAIRMITATKMVKEERGTEPLAGAEKRRVTTTTTVEMRKRAKTRNGERARGRNKRKKGRMRRRRRRRRGRGRRRRRRRGRRRGRRRRRRRKKRSSTKDKKNTIGDIRSSDAWAAFENKPGKNRPDTKSEGTSHRAQDKSEPPEKLTKLDTFDDVKLDNPGPSPSPNSGGSTGTGTKQGLFGWGGWGGPWAWSNDGSGKHEDREERGIEKPERAEGKRERKDGKKVENEDKEREYTDANSRSADRIKSNKREKLYAGPEEPKTEEPATSDNPTENKEDDSLGFTSTTKEKNKRKLLLREGKEGALAENQGSEPAAAGNPQDRQSTSQENRKGVAAAVAELLVRDTIAPSVDTALRPSSKKTKKRIASEPIDPEPPAPGPELDPMQDANPWADVPPTSKRKNKNSTEETKGLKPTSEPETKTTTTLNDAGSLGTKDRNKKGKVIEEESVGERAPSLHEAENKEGDDRGDMAASGKSKKNTTRTAVADSEGIAEKTQEPETKPDIKKERKKKSRDTKPEPEPEPVPEPEPKRVPEPEPIKKESKKNEKGWITGLVSTLKKVKGIADEEVQEPESRPVAEPPPESEGKAPEKKEKRDFDNDQGDTKAEKRRRKKGAGTVEEQPEGADPEPDPEAEFIPAPAPANKAEDELPSVASGSKKSKKNRGATVPAFLGDLGPDMTLASEPQPETEPDKEKAEGDRHGPPFTISDSSKKDERKKKKKKKDGGEEEALQEPEPPRDLELGDDLAGNDFAEWNVPVREKKKKKNESLHQTPKILPEPGVSQDDDLLAFGSSKDKKKSKKGAAAIEEPSNEKTPDTRPSEPEPDPETTLMPVAEQNGGAWSFWGAKKNTTKPKDETPNPITDEGWLDWSKNKLRSSGEFDKESDHKHPPPNAPGTHSAAGSADFWDSHEVGKDKRRNADDSLMPDSIEEPKNDDIEGGNTSKKEKKKKKGSKNVPVEVANGSHLNVVQPDSIEESKGNRVEDDDWTWGNLDRGKKKSPPPAPTPPSLELSLSDQELEEHGWGGLKTEEEEKAEAEAAALADVIASEEEELATLRAMKKLTKKDRRRLDQLTANANRRAEEKAAREAEQAAQREAEERAASEAREKADAEALVAEIAAEEEEMAMLTTKSKKKKLRGSDKKRLEELTERAKVRAGEKIAEEAEEQTTMPDMGETVPEAEEQIVSDAEERAARVAEERAAQEAEERAQREREEAEAAAKKKSKKGSKSDDKKSRSTNNKDKPSKRDKNKEGDRSKGQDEDEVKNDDNDKVMSQDQDQDQTKDGDLDSLDLENLDPDQVEEILAGTAAPKPQGQPQPQSKTDLFSFWSGKSKSPPPELVSEDATVEVAPSSSKEAVDDWVKPRKTKGSKLADKLKKFEPAKDDDAPINALSAPPPPPPQPVAILATRSAREDKPGSSEDLLPGAFPDEGENEIVDIIDMAPVKKKKGKKGKTKPENVIPPPPQDPISPPPPPEVPIPPSAVPETPSTPPPEVKSSRRERPKINRDASTSWVPWSAAPRKEEQMPMSEEKKHGKVKEEKEKTSSSKGSSSDRVEERGEKKSTATAKPRVNSVFQSTPPLSRSMSTRDKRYGTSRQSSRRHSVDMMGESVSPPPGEIPEISPKAAKVLGVDKSHRSRRSFTTRGVEDEDVAPRAADMSASPQKSAHRRSKVKIDDDAGMADAVAFDVTPPLKRSNSTTKKGLTSLFGGLMSPAPRAEARPEPRRRNTQYMTDDEARPDRRTKKSSRDYRDADDDAVEEEREARRAARRARRAEEKAAEEARLAKEEARRERHRKYEEEVEARKQAEREARRAERRALREREAERLALEAKEAERAERRRLRKLEKEAAAAAEEAEAEARRAARAERRRSRYVDASEDDREERRRRREARYATEERHNQRRSMPTNDYVYPRERSSRPTVYEHGRSKNAAWPHSGTDSWVKEHSDAGPPPEHGPAAEVPREDDEEARRAARRARRRAKYGEAEPEIDEDRRRRHARREERDRRDRRPGGSDGSAEKPHRERESFFTDSTPRSSWWKKLTGA
ncbi:hypothetical protein GGS23DRAFT_111647 [Durotheca rogersii]|uniref:uncharacterized protein n=1 Tax=Durotheca rogersii TaxID=419775 RepID=UPI00221E3B58|nr:uncharacterized protein GGS23DRAFT_111647 [Durotheca rogersii]KAI5862213.1 hypothetical protein GGS23DRAFT_111647 [Durotheca rogersii]